MGNEVANQTGTRGLSFVVPAHIAARIKAAGGGNIADRATVNQLTFGGKVWTMHVNGEKKILQRPNEDGDMENVQTIKVVVVGNPKDRGRDFYEEAVQRGRPEGAGLLVGRRAQAEHSSRGAPGTARARHALSGQGLESRRGWSGARLLDVPSLVVVPVSSRTRQPDFSFPPLRLKLRSSSIWD